MQNQQQLSDDHHRRISTALEQALGVTDWEILDLANGGFSGAYVYIVKAGAKLYAAKLEDRNELEADPARFYPNVKIAGEHGVSPKVLYADANERILLLEFIKAKPLQAASAHTVKELASHIRKLHHLPLFAEWKSPDAVLEHFTQKLPTSYLNSDIIHHALRHSRDILAAVTDPADDRSSHCDLNPNNVLYNGSKYFLIDWQASCKRSFYFDLGSCAVFFYFFDKKLQDLFLREYLQHEPDAQETAKYELMQTFLYIYYGILFLVLPFLNNVEQKPLTEREISALPSFGEFMEQIGLGYVNLGNHEVQQRFGYVFLNTGMQYISTARYNEQLRQAKT